MRGARNSAISTFALLAVFAVAGCAGGTWQSPKASEPTAPVTTAEPATPAPAPEPPTAVETAMPLTPGAFTERPELREVRFRPGQLAVVKADHPALDAVVRWMKEHRSTVVMIEGHTDDQGTRDSNRAAGEKRAWSIRNYLVEKEIEPARISISSLGSDRPICHEKTDPCRAKNRRVRFLVK